MRSTLLFIMLIIAVAGFSQEKLQDVVYLKNGNVLRGTIIEQVPMDYIKLKTADGSEFIFQVEEIEKITKEENPLYQLSQDEKRKGYVGITIGTSMPIGEFNDDLNGAADTGLQLNLINLGYLFNDKFGLGFTWFGAANPLDYQGFDPWSYGGLLIGPIISTQVAKNLEIDLRLLLGYFNATVPDIGMGPENAGNFGLDVGGMLRYNVSRGFALLLSVEYISANLDFPGYNFEQQFSVISLNGGLALRFQ